MHHKPEPDDLDELSKLGYDRRDVRMKPLAWAVIGFFAFTLLSASVIIPIYNYLIPGGILAGESPEAIQRRWETPQPPLQDKNTAVKDIREMRRREHEVLNTAGPSLEEPGKLRIPIDVAIDKIAAEGLPKPTATPKGENIR